MRLPGRHGLHHFLSTHYQQAQVNRSLVGCDEEPVNNAIEAFQIALAGITTMLAAQQCRDYGAPLRFRLEGAHDKTPTAPCVVSDAQRTL
ncbi:MAG: hypothetical protein E5X25_00505 [Mesorhizobium sp.]|nr:MAG: hypothetical protein E5X25_00505 [Mesorhizobium sp.]